MDIQKKILNALNSAEMLTITKLAEKVKEPRVKISGCIELMEGQGLIKKIPVASGYVIIKK